MTSSKIHLATSALLAILVFLIPAADALGEVPGAEDKSEKHVTTSPRSHPNHFGGFLGATTHLDDNDETAFTLGLEYARQISPRFAVAAYTEVASGSVERDIIVAVGGVFYPIHGLGLVVAPGVELVDKTVEHHGETTTEKETEFLLRFGVAYGFLVAGTSLGPAVFADWARDRWTIVYGVGWTVGF